MTPEELLAIVLAAGVPAVAVVLGGSLALLHRPSTLFGSVVFGFAGGALLATVSLEMLPRSVAEAGIWIAVVSFALGFAVVYGFDLLMHRGVVAGERAEQRWRVERAYRRRPPRGGGAQFVASAISLESVVEGLAIGVSLSVAPSVALIVGLAIVVDNLSEGIAIAELFREQAGDPRRVRRPALIWTSLVGLALFVPAVMAWLLLGRVNPDLHAVLLAAGAGGLLYLTLTDLLPEAQQRHYQQSAAVAGGAAFALVMVISRLTQGG